MADHVSGVVDGKYYHYNTVPDITLGVPRHPTSQRFHDLLAELGRLHDQRQRGYGTAEDPLHNVRASTEWNMPAWVGAMLRATDKVRRLQAVARGTEITDEKVVDLFNDLAIYSLLARILYEEDHP